jgi:hypothetical protein
MAARHIGKPALELAARYLGPQHDGAALVETDEVERVLTDVDPDRGDRIRRILMGVHRRLLEL